MISHSLKLTLTFLTVIIIWSFTPLAIKWSAGDAPLVSLLIRILIGVFCCMGLLALTKTKISLGFQERRLYLVCGISIYLPMSLIYLASQHIPSGWIAVVFGLSPLITGVFSLLVEPEDRLTASRTLGLLLGIAGLYLVFSASLSFEESSIKGMALVLSAVTISSASSVLTRYLAKNMSIQGMQTTIGGLLVAIPCFAITAWVNHTSGDSGFAILSFDNFLSSFGQREWISIVFLGVIGTGVGFSLYYYLLKEVSANRVSLITLITPITALAVGSWFNNEPLVPQVWIGAALVCTGLLLYEFKPKFGMRKL